LHAEIYYQGTGSFHQGGEEDNPSLLLPEALMLMDSARHCNRLKELLKNDALSSAINILNKTKWKLLTLYVLDLQERGHLGRFHIECLQRDDDSILVGFHDSDTSRRKKSRII
jgi:hypothetical protein